MSRPRRSPPPPSCLAAALLAALACSGDITTDPGGDDGPDAAGSAGRPDARPGDPPAPDAAAPPAPDATPPGYDSLSADEQALFDTINAERMAAGQGAVALRADLICAAARHSADIGSTGQCTHTGSDGSSPGDRVAACSGPGWSGEIVACGQGSARAAVDAWLGSPGHNAILLDGGQRFIGVAMHNNYWTAIFDR